MGNCISCHKNSLDAIIVCPKCFSKIRVADGPGAFGTCLFRYEETIRRLVIQAKVSTDYRSLTYLSELFLQNPQSQAALQASDVLVPCPASLYSRCAGRYDVAYALAYAGSKRYSKPIAGLPWRNYWQVQKRSLQQGRVRLDVAFENNGKRIRALIIDDVMTSGHTIARVGLSLLEYDCRYLCLAEAKHSPALPKPDGVVAIGNPFE